MTHKSTTTQGLQQIYKNTGFPLWVKSHLNSFGIGPSNEALIECFRTQ
jgi:hypothetical protein